MVGKRLYVFPPLIYLWEFLVSYSTCQQSSLALPLHSSLCVGVYEGGWMSVKSIRCPRNVWKYQISYCKVIAWIYLLCTDCLVRSHSNLNETALLEARIKSNTLSINCISRSFFFLKVPTKSSQINTA